MGKKKKPRTDGFDSDEEMYFSWYLDELVEAGYVESYHKIRVGYVLSEKLVNQYVKPMKRVENKKKDQTIINGHEYTPDFVIRWAKKALGVFAQRLGDGDKHIAPFMVQGYYDKSVVEIKADFDMNNMTRLVTLNIKWVLQRYNLIISLTKVPSIFRKTFTPKKYLVTNKTGKPRKIKFEVKTLEEFILEKQ